MLHYVTVNKHTRIHVRVCNCEQTHTYICYSM